MSSNGKVFTMPSRVEMYKDLEKVSKDLGSVMRNNKRLNKEVVRIRILLTFAISFAIFELAIIALLVLRSF